jgi:gliding motility-associated protein GldC
MKSCTRLLSKNQCVPLHLENNAMQVSTITIDVTLDPQKIPVDIHWNATQSNSEDKQQAKAMMVSFWDGKEKAAMRVDLWTKEMMVDEMADFYYQNLMTMADTLERATHQSAMVEELRTFAKGFYKKFRDTLSQQS